MLAISLLSAALFAALLVCLARLRRQRAEYAECRRELGIYDRFANDWIWRQDAHFRFTGIRGGAYGREHIDLRRLIGRTRWDPPGELLDARAMALHRAACERHEAFHQFQYGLRFADGSVRWFVTSGEPEFDAAGRFAGYRGVAREESGRLRAEGALQRSEQQFAAIAAGSPVPMFALDEAGRVILWNRGCEVVLGVPAGQMLGHDDPWRAFYAAPRPVLAHCVMAADALAAAAPLYGARLTESVSIPGALEVEGFFPELGGRDRWLHFVAAPMRGPSGAIIGAIETLQDITERKRAEQALAALNAELEERVRVRTSELSAANARLAQAMDKLVQSEKLASLGGLVAGVAHELNTPLGNAVTVASTLRERIDAFGAAAQSGPLRRSALVDFLAGCRDAAELLGRNLERAAQQIGQFKQVAVDRASERRRRFELRTTIDGIVATLRARLKRTPHQVQVEVEAGIELDSYPGPLEQVLGNLIDNALIHAFADGRPGSIRVRGERCGEAVRIEVADDGAGMSAEVRAHAFDPFFTTRMGSGGSGLGLYIAFNLVSATLGGSIELDSTPGGGSRITIELPLEAPRTDPA